MFLEMGIGVSSKKCHLFVMLSQQIHLWRRLCAVRPVIHKKARDPSKMKTLYAALIAGALVTAAHSASASVVIPEVDPFGSKSNDGYVPD